MHNAQTSVNGFHSGNTLFPLCVAHAQHNYSRAAFAASTSSFSMASRGFIAAALA